MAAFSVVQLPKPTREATDGAVWIGLAESFRTLRLRSLERAPEAFASTYETKAQRGLEQTLDRLSNPKARQFIAVEDDGAVKGTISDGCPLDGLCKKRWVGMIVLLGPMQDAVTPRADPIRSTSSGKAGDSTLLDTNPEGRRTLPAEFVLNGVFVEPSARGRGVGKALLDTALEQVTSPRAEGEITTFVTVLVNVENHEARKLYEKAGFARVGEEKYTQQPRGLLGEVQRKEKVAL